MGTPIATPGFHSALCLYPPGTLVSWQDNKKTVTVYFSITTFKEPGPAALDRAQGDKNADTGPPDSPRVKPRFAVTAIKGLNDPRLPQGFKGRLMDHLGEGGVELCCSHTSPWDAVTELFSLQKLAKTLPSAHNRDSRQPGSPTRAASRPNDSPLAEWHAKQLTRLKENAKLLGMLQEIPLPPVRWPRLLFGLSTVSVLAKLEGHQAVENCHEYLYVEVRST
jgi:hypothetical protein